MIFAKVPIATLSKLNFSELNQAAPSTCRRTLDGKYAIVSWQTTKPKDIGIVTQKTEEQMTTEVKKAAWTNVT